MRPCRLLAAALMTTVVALTGCAGDGAGSGGSHDGTPAPAAGACLKMGKVNDLTRQRAVPCDSPHEGQVFAVLALPDAVTNPSVHQQVTAAEPSLTCPDVRAWSGYKGTIPLGLFRTWRFPTKQQIAAGAHWAACVAIRAPGADHVTLTATRGSLAGALAGATSPLPLLGRCAAHHINASFTPVTCVPGSTQWVWLGAHRKPSLVYPGKAKAKEVADAGCRRFVTVLGGSGAWVYYPTSVAVWNRTHADWSCWMPLPRSKG